jgi:hypothetical protein
MVGALVVAGGVDTARGRKGVETHLVDGVRATHSFLRLRGVVGVDAVGAGVWAHVGKELVSNVAVVAEGGRGVGDDEMLVCMGGVVGLDQICKVRFRLLQTFRVVENRSSEVAGVMELLAHQGIRVANEVGCEASDICLWVALGDECGTLFLGARFLGAAIAMAPSLCA